MYLCILSYRCFRWPGHSDAVHWTSFFVPSASAHLAVSARPPHILLLPQGSLVVGGRLIATFVLEILSQRHLAQSEDKSDCNIYSCACVNNNYYYYNDPDQSADNAFFYNDTINIIRYKLLGTCKEE